MSADRPRFVAAFAAVAAVGLTPAAAQAHLVSTRFGDFYGGMLHPLTALEHVLPWLALGLLAGLQPVRMARWIPLAFTGAVLAGVLAAAMAPGWPLPTALTLLSFVVLGVLVSIGREWPAALLLGLAVVVGGVHGYDNGLAMTPETNAWLFVPGVATTGIVLLLLVTAATTVAVGAAGWSRIAVRAAGSWIAAVGIMVVGLRLGA